jgi:hypothetical protein
MDCGRADWMKSKPVSALLCAETCSFLTSAAI